MIFLSLDIALASKKSTRQKWDSKKHTFPQQAAQFEVSFVSVAQTVQHRTCAICEMLSVTGNGRKKNLWDFLSSKSHLCTSDCYDTILNTTTIEKIENLLKKSIWRLNQIPICTEAILPIYWKWITQQHHTVNVLRSLSKHKHHS